MNVSVLLQRSSRNAICLPCLLISRWNISKVRRFFNLSDYQLFPTTASPAEQIAVSGIKRSVFDEWCQISLFRPRCISGRERETNEEIGKFSNHWMATMIFESKENGALLFAYLSLTWYHIEWYVVFSDLFSNANMELGVPATGQVRMMRRIKAFSNHNTGIL